MSARACICARGRLRPQRAQHCAAPSTYSRCRWLRDSTNQVWPYLRYLRNDSALRTLVAGVVHRQAVNVLLQPYANAFQIDGSRPGPHASDDPIPKGAINNWIFEYKW